MIVEQICLTCWKYFIKWSCVHTVEVNLSQVISSHDDHLNIHNEEYFRQRNEYVPYTNSSTAF